MTDAIVGAGSATVAELATFLEAKGVGRVAVIEHEDDLPEVRLLVEWAWRRLGAESRRILGVLSHVEGDHMDTASLATLARLRSAPEKALAPLQRWHLVQEPMRGRFAVHAVVRHAVVKRTVFAPERAFQHYVALLEDRPERLVWEQTHLFAAMDHAHRIGNVGAMLRIERLLARLDDAAPS